MQPKFWLQTFNTPKFNIKISGAKRKKEKRKKKNINKCDLIWCTPKLSMDSTTSPKVTTTKGEGVGVRFSICSILGVDGCVGAPRWGLGKLTSK